MIVILAGWSARESLDYKEHEVIMDQRKGGLKMKDITLKNSSLLIENKKRIKDVYGWESGLIHLACAGIYVSKRKEVDVAVLYRCKQLLKDRVGVFSNFRSTAQPMIASILATSKNPEQALEDGLSIYQLLKKEFWSSTYLPIAAMIIGQMAQKDQFEAIAVRTRRIYDRLKQEHPFLTNSQDSANCALLALSEKTDDELIHDMEYCYKYFKSSFFSSDAVQSLSHVLAMTPGNNENKCQRTSELFYKLKAEGHKYGTTYELPTLGVLAMCEEPMHKLIQETVEVNDWIANQKGFGFFSTITAKQRLMYAGIVAMSEYLDQDAMNSVAVNSTVSLIVAQEVAMCAAIMASSSASMADSSSTSSN